MFEVIPFCGLSIYQMMMLFIIWSFLGWAMEVCVHTLKMGEYSDRGFLSMPLCPIYGFGANIITVVLRPVLGDPLVLFITSAVICTAFEFAVGVMLKKIFHNQWWDYSDEPFNFHGYICLKVTIEWGVVCLIGESFAIPAILGLVDMIPRIAGIVFICISAVLILIDTGCSYAAAQRLTLHIREFAELNSKMYDTAERLGSSLGNAALETSAAIQENAGIAQVRADNLTEDIHSAAHDVKRLMRMRYDAYMAFRGDRRELRLLKAFPGMHPDTGTDIIKELRDMSVGKWVNSVVENIREKLHADSVGELIGREEDDE